METINLLPEDLQKRSSSPLSRVNASVQSNQSMMDPHTQLVQSYAPALDTSSLLNPKSQTTALYPLPVAKPSGSSPKSAWWESLFVKKNNQPTLQRIVLSTNSALQASQPAPMAIPPSPAKASKPKKENQEVVYVESQAEFNKPDPQANQKQQIPVSDISAHSIATQKSKRTLLMTAFALWGWLKTRVHNARAHVAFGADVNLISDEIAVRLRSAKLFRAAAVSVTVLLIVIALIRGGLEVITHIRARELKTRIVRQTELKQDNDALSKKVASAQGIQNRLAQISVLLSRHIHWVRLLDLIERQTLAGVSYQDLNVDSSKAGKLVLNAIAYKQEDVMYQVQLFQEAPEVVAVKMSGSSVSDKTNATAPAFESNGASVAGEHVKQIPFVLELTLDPTFLYGD